MHPRLDLVALALLSIAPLIAGCFYSSENVAISSIKSDAIFQIYRARYIAEKDETRVYARFRVGGQRGTNIELTEGSAVRCNGKPLEESSLFGRCYVATIPGFASDIEFDFRDAEGASLKNAMQLRRADFIDDMPATLNRDAGQTLQFAGPPLVEGETIELRTNVDQAELQRLSEEDPFKAREKRLDNAETLGWSNRVGATAVELNPDVLGELSDGPINLQWIREVDSNLQAATPTGGVVRGRYHSAAQRVTIE